MRPVTNDLVLQQLEWRYATKKFDATKKIPPADWDALEKALVLTPSSYGLQPWRFVVVTNPAVKAKLVEASWDQRQPADCSHHVAFAIRKGLSAADIDRYVQRLVEVRGGTLESFSGYRDRMVESQQEATADGSIDHWCARQVYIALGNFMTSAALLGIDTCPMEGIEPEKYDAILGLGTKGYSTVVACAAGYRSEDDRYARSPKVRFRLEDIIEKIA
jgi:nitroreductase